MNILVSKSGLKGRRRYPIKMTPTNREDNEVWRDLATVKDNIKEFVEEGNNLFLCSKFTGNGKTTWAIKLLLKYFDAVWAGNGGRCRGVFVHVPTLLQRIKNFDDPGLPELRDNILNADLVVWDDIASTSISRYDYAQLLIFIDHRDSNKLSNIYTSNVVDKGKLQEALGARLVSRVYTGSKIYEFKGKDWRSVRK